MTFMIEVGMPSYPRHMRITSLIEVEINVSLKIDFTIEVGIL
jgi:hypothetical protein